MATRFYGWKPSSKKSIELAPKLKLYRLGGPKLAPATDLRTTGWMPGVFDQGQLGSCTANGIAGLIQYTLAKEKLFPFAVSRLFLYYQERKIEGTISEDSGANISDGIQVCKTVGFCHESAWQYDIAKFAVNPPVMAYNDARKHHIVKYWNIDNRNVLNVKTILSKGLPVVMGFNVYENFESDSVAQNGILTFPGKMDQQVGGHCTLIVGYDDTMKYDSTNGGSGQGMYLVRNSWGQSWGLTGYFWAPYDLFANPNMASDFWTISFAK